MKGKKSSFFGNIGDDSQVFNVDTIETEVILTNEEFARMMKESPGSFPATRTVRRKDKDTGAMVKEVQRLFRIDAVGRKIANNDVVAMSWTDQPIPHDRYGICANPFRHHSERAVFVGHDGEVTELGNVLCYECLEHQGRRMNLARWIGLGGLLWKPEEF